MEKITLNSLTGQFIETAVTYVGNYDFVRIIAEDVARNCFYALTESGNDENAISDWFEYLQKHGCLSGTTKMFNDAIDCKWFYSEHIFELDEWIYSLDFEERPSLEEPRFDSMCWFAYEYIARIIYDHSYLGYVVEEDEK